MPNDGTWLGRRELPNQRAHIQRELHRSLFHVIRDDAHLDGRYACSVPSRPRPAHNSQRPPPPITNLSPITEPVCLSTNQPVTNQFPKRRSIPNHHSIQSICQ